MFPDGGGGLYFFFMVRPVKVATLMNMNYSIYDVFIYRVYQSLHKAYTVAQ